MENREMSFKIHLVYLLADEDEHTDSHLLWF